MSSYPRICSDVVTERKNQLVANKLFSVIIDGWTPQKITILSLLTKDRKILKFGFKGKERGLSTQNDSGLAVGYYL